MGVYGDTSLPLNHDLVLTFYHEHPSIFNMTKKKKNTIMMALLSVLFAKP
jgi:hypothetical protein